jgi:CRISPR-associated protein Csb3
MMTTDASIALNVDLCNPGQFFACCGLLELADRLWPSALSWFDDHTFFIHGDEVAFDDLLEQMLEASLTQLDPDDECASPIAVGHPFHLRLDWWKDTATGGDRLKVWAGRMAAQRIATAMRRACEEIGALERMLDHAAVAYTEGKKRKKVEPFYFDSRRGANSQSTDVGFATDPLKITALAYPAVEFLCLVGLQRFRPCPTDRPRVFTYAPWELPLPIEPASAVAAGAIRLPATAIYRFEAAFRTDQRKHKAFMPATMIGA